VLVRGSQTGELADGHALNGGHAGEAVCAKVGIFDTLGLPLSPAGGGDCGPARAA